MHRRVRQCHALFTASHRAAFHFAPSFMAHQPQRSLSPPPSLSYSVPVDEPLSQGRIRRIGTCPMHTSWICSLDFSTDSSLMRSCSSAGDLLLWNLPECKRNSQHIMARDVQWATSTCAVAWEARSVWEEGSDLATVTCLQRSPVGLKGEALLFSGDKNGFLKMFAWPAAASMQVACDECHCRLGTTHMTTRSSPALPATAITFHPLQSTAMQTTSSGD